MVKIVARSCQRERHEIPLVKVAFVLETAQSPEVIESLAEVGSVRRIVVRDVAVASLNPLDESEVVLACYR